ncbi:hypothetical protein IPA_02530 [Ignicoccus pacificus DSM 13166]|uniref:DUF3800 domain-containing protein n=1 Tax=Ignicoccus pacificus DSM 13166 TaxID=940294 RepID=A0A977PKN4_9CREN|nr:hypothetical protein IPA_02530 [Ignicoccus pacificus DSM 13166]
MKAVQYLNSSPKAIGTQKDVVVLAMVVMNDSNYAKFKSEWMKELQNLFGEIFENMALSVRNNPFELYKIEDIMMKRPKMELHTQDLVSKEHIFSFISTEPSTKRLDPFVEILNRYASNIYALLVKRSAHNQINPVKKCSDNKVSPWVLTKFTEAVLESENIQDDLFIIVVDTDPKAESPYSYETVLEFLRRRFFDTSSKALSKFNAISVFLSPSEWEPGIQAADLASYIIRKVYSGTSHNTEKMKVIHNLYNKISRCVRLFEIRLDDCSEKSIRSSKVREIERGVLCA